MIVTFTTHWLSSKVTIYVCVYSMYTSFLFIFVSLLWSPIAVNDKQVSYFSFLFFIFSHALLWPSPSTAKLFIMYSIHFSCVFQPCVVTITAVAVNRHLLIFHMYSNHVLWPSLSPSTVNVKSVFIFLIFNHAVFIPFQVQQYYGGTCSAKGDNVIVSNRKVICQRMSELLPVDKVACGTRDASLCVRFLY